MTDREKVEWVMTDRETQMKDGLIKFESDLRDENEQAKLFEEHENLISDILLEEEELLDFHKKKLDQGIKDFELENQLLNEVDAPGSDIDRYIGSLKGLLRKKMMGIMDLKDLLNKFENNLKKEKLLNERIHEIMKGDGEDDNIPINNNNDEQNSVNWNNYMGDKIIAEESQDYTNDQNHNRLVEESPIHNRANIDHMNQYRDSGYNLNAFDPNDMNHNNPDINPYINNMGHNLNHNRDHQNDMGRATYDNQDIPNSHMGNQKYSNNPNHQHNYGVRDYSRNDEAISNNNDLNSHPVPARQKFGGFGGHQSNY